MNPRTRGAANSLYRSTGRGSQRKALQDLAVSFREESYFVETQDGLHSLMYENIKPRERVDNLQEIHTDQTFLRQKRANSAFEFYMRQRQGVSEDIFRDMPEAPEEMVTDEPREENFSEEVSQQLISGL